MTVSKTASLGFDGGKGSGVAASGVVPWGGPHTGLADLGLAYLALGRPVALSVQGEALQQLAMEDGQTGGQQDGPVRMKRPPARLGWGAESTAPAGNVDAVKKGAAATTWSRPLPGKGGAEEGAKRPTRRRVWPVEPGVPASTRVRAWARHGEGAALVMRHDRVGQDQDARRQFGLKLLELGRRRVASQHSGDVSGCGEVRAEHDGSVQQILRGDAQLTRAMAQTPGPLETEGPGAVVAVCDAPRRHRYGASPWMTRTSWRSGRSSRTGTAPFESRSMAIACSADTRSWPLSSALMCDRARMPNWRARSACVSPADFRHARMSVMTDTSDYPTFESSGHRRIIGTDIIQARNQTARHAA